MHNSIKTAMTVAALRDELAQYEDDAPVFFVIGYGDRVNTQQALPVVTVDEEDGRLLETTAYSESGLRLADEEEKPLEADGQLFEDEIVILRV